MKQHASLEQYYADHAVCPKCQSGVGSTLMGFVFRKDRPFKDENICYCKCGWKGITHDLVPKPSGGIMGDALRDVQAKCDKDMLKQVETALEDVELKPVQDKLEKSNEKKP
jgi:hypothetical protein